MFLRSPSGTSPPSGASSVPATLFAGTDSPVRAASSIFIEALSRMRQSAGTESPASSTTTSPTTSSEEDTATILPSRTALLCAADISCRAARASSALDSWTTPSTAFTTTTKQMMITSAKSASPWAMPVSAEMTAATISMMIMGSAICARNRFHSGSFSASLSLFRPSRSRRAAASPAVSPRSPSEPTASRTAEESCRYSFNFPSWIIRPAD